MFDLAVNDALVVMSEGDKEYGYRNESN